MGPNPYINELFQSFNNGYYSSTKTCGGEYTVALNQQTQISSPNYPAQYPTSVRCNYLIKVNIILLLSNEIIMFLTNL